MKVKSNFVLVTLDWFFFAECDEYLEQVTRQLSYLPLTVDSRPVSIKVSDCDAGNVQLIVGGEEAKLGEFPHMVLIFHTTYIL
jgi:hypothetical protein